jgi:hypothetical protein
MPVRVLKRRFYRGASGKVHGVRLEPVNARQGVEAGNTLFWIS